MATAPFDDKQGKNLIATYKSTIANQSGSGDVTLYFPTNVAKNTGIHVFKNSATATISVSMDTRLPNATNDAVGKGAILTDLETEADFYEVSSDALDYYAGSNPLISCVKVRVQNSSADVVINVTQIS